MRSSAATVQTVLRCSSAVLSKNTTAVELVAAAKVRPARNRCQRLSVQGGARELMLKKQDSSIYELLFLLRQQLTAVVVRTVKIYLATVQEMTSSSAWNHIFKFRPRGRDGRRSPKLLSLCHTHGSAPRSPHLPRQMMD